MQEAADLMQVAINKAKEGIEQGQSPFGCAISLEGEILAVAHNTVVADPDITAHAEINAIRKACKVRGDIFIENAIVATTCEPCPMCMAALHWARVRIVYYGATIDDAKNVGFNELLLPAADLLRQGGSQVQLTPGIKRQECQNLFELWNRSENKRAY